MGGSRSLRSDTSWDSRRYRVNGSSPSLRVTPRSASGSGSSAPRSPSRPRRSPRAPSAIGSRSSTTTRATTCSISRGRCRRATGTRSSRTPTSSSSAIRCSTPRTPTRSSCGPSPGSSSPSAAASAGASAGHQLKVAPHAFADANAFYSRGGRGAALRLLPRARSGPVFTCLSHDVVVHETTHALARRPARALHGSVVPGPGGVPRRLRRRRRAAVGVLAAGRRQRLVLAGRSRRDAPS